MNHPIHRVTACKLIPPYTLRLRFDDNLRRSIDFEPVLEGELYGPLRDPAAFAQVTLDPEVHTIVWPNGADFDPATLHDWPQHEAAFRAAALRWSLAGEADDNLLAPAAMRQAVLDSFYDEADAPLT